MGGPPALAPTEGKGDINRLGPVSSTAEGDIENIKQRAVRDLDVGAIYAEAAREQPPTREEEVAVRWKVDLRIMPILFFNVILASVDKTSTSTGAL